MSWGEVSTTPPAKIRRTRRRGRREEARGEDQRAGSPRPRPAAAGRPVRGPPRHRRRERRPGAHGGIVKSPKSPTGKVKMPVKLAGGTPGRPLRSAARRASDRVRPPRTPRRPRRPARSRFRPRTDKPPRTCAARAQATLTVHGVETGLAAVVQEIVPSRRRSLWRPQAPSAFPPSTNPRGRPPPHACRARSARPDGVKTRTKRAAVTRKDLAADDDDGHPKPLYPEPGVEEWELERVDFHDGATYLVDRYNGSNIAVTRLRSEWPVSVGKLVRGFGPAESDV